MDPFTLALLGSTAASAIGGGINYMGSKQAAGAQSSAAQQSGILNMIAQQQAQERALQALRESQAKAEGVGREFYGKGIDYMQPYYGAGTGATNQLARLYGQDGEFTRMPTLAELQMDPGYAFREQQGMQALNRTAAAQAGLQSGTALKAGQRFGQELASQEYGNAYNRFMQNRAAVTQGLQNLAGTGASMAQTGGTGAFNVGSNIASGILNTGQNIAATTGVSPVAPYTSGLENAAQARASSYMGGASALENALQTPVNAMMAYGMADKFAPARTSTYAPQQVGYLGGVPSYGAGYSPGFMGAPTFGAPRV